ncbi:fungal-specific transcription factor domain-containing protein [Fomitopsis serialis]|uniref:fungal-specific transcription factor domain-containing protein n=1 Tax=Fomitopsis serialis TaxID=139415 RepID=UPI002008AECA|nr:fungal-specific transcription factor domain-containing protein [Neoantrodia serialis]KAH9925726.1 fungal-specific transcription factor domain-containing protein [Neoantrodia serialis]
MPPTNGSDEEQSAEAKPSTSTSNPSATGSSTSSILKERRFKLSRACDRCRRRRIKCDEGHPCQSCLTSNSSCTFEEPGKRTHPHKSKRAATLEDRMHHLETLIQAIPPAVFAAGGAGAAPPHSPIDPSTSPHASFANSTHIFPTAVPPPSLNSYPLMNPSTFFAPVKATRNASPSFSGGQSGSIVVDNLMEDTARMSLSSSYLYFDDEGYTRWQGETSGLPLLDSLVERHNMAIKPDPERGQAQAQAWTSQNGQPVSDWFPDRTSKRVDNNPEAVWKLITSFIAPELMDSLVQCFLSTTYYLLPLLHVPTFLSDYGNPRKWGEPGFAAFVVAVCCLSSRHIDDPRVRGDPSDGNSAGTQWFELFGRLRTLPSADRPTIYTVQAVLVAGVYAVGLGKLSKAFGLLAEAVTLSIDIGLHRSVDDYDVFDPIEDEVRKRTFWCVYLWDKQASSYFGRPPVIRLRDCDVGEPAIVDDELITRDGVGPRMGAFVSTVRIFIVLESVVDIPPPRPVGDACSPFLARASSVLGPFKRTGDLSEEEALLDDIVRSLPPHWAHSVETMTSDDVLRVTQANRLHCAQQYVRMLIHRHRFSEMVAERTQTGIIEQTDAEVEAMRAAHACALQIISSHLHIAAKGLMTYYGVHVIHQLTAAGRTLVAILLCCQPEKMQPLIAPGLEALRSSVGLLKRFSGRYICGQRSGDLLEEFCRLTAIPLDAVRNECPGASNRPAWVRPARKKTPSSARSPAHSADSPSHHGSPEDFSADAFLDLRAKSQEPNLFASSSSSTQVVNGFGGLSSFMDTSNGMDMIPEGPGVGTGWARELRKQQSVNAHCLVLREVVDGKLELVLKTAVVVQHTARQEVLQLLSVFVGHVFRPSICTLIRRG